MSVSVTDQEGDGLRFLIDACQRLELDAEMTEILAASSREIKVDLPIRGDDGSITHFSGYRVQHHNVFGPYKGGLRYHPDIGLEDLRWLACLMSLKTALMELPLGGAKGGIDCDPRVLSRSELQQLTRYFVRKIHRNIGPYLDIPGPDAGTDAQVMAWIQDEYSVLYGNSPGAVTGKPVLLGGSEGRDSATGRGVALIMNEFAKHRAEELTGLSASIHGFGNVGRNAAFDLKARGMRIIAVSDSHGAVYNQTGLDIERLAQHKDATGTVTGFTEAEAFSHHDLLTLECDYLIPAAIGRDIDEGLAGKIAARVVVEAANNPTTYAAHRMLEERDIVVLPDILVNAGGVIVSYFEWVQNLQQVTWSADRVSTELASKLQKACARVFAVETGRGGGYRSSAYEVAITRLKQGICTAMF